MGRMDTANRAGRTRLILFAVWLVSFVVMTICTIVIMAYSGPMPLRHRVLLFLPVQVASGFFFPISIGKIMQLVRESDVATVLWNFISDCSEAGLSRFYASREEAAKADLEKRFEHHRKGDIFLTGPSLRLFLAPGAHFHAVIERNIKRYEAQGTTIRVVNVDWERNVSLPIRAFVEEFNPDGQHPRGKHRRPFPCESDLFDWSASAQSSEFDLSKFCTSFYRHYGKTATQCKSRCVADLEAVDGGIRELNAMTENAGLIRARRSVCAPYFTAVIFPDVCYYTPSMLSPYAPVNMPMLTFLKGGPVYEKILTHFKLIWWLGRSYDE